jgi:hypothetical protein
VGNTKTSKYMITIDYIIHSITLQLLKKEIVPWHLGQDLEDTWAIFHYFLTISDYFWHEKQHQISPIAHVKFL